MEEDKKILADKLSEFLLDKPVDGQKLDDYYDKLPLSSHAPSAEQKKHIKTKLDLHDIDKVAKFYLTKEGFAVLLNALVGEDVLSKAEFLDVYQLIAVADEEAVNFAVGNLWPKLHSLKKKGSSGLEYSERLRRYLVQDFEVLFSGQILIAPIAALANRGKRGATGAPAGTFNEPPLKRPMGEQYCFNLWRAGACGNPLCQRKHSLPAEAEFTSLSKRFAELLKNIDYSKVKTACEKHASSKRQGTPSTS